VTKVTAAVLHEYGGEFELEELELAPPADRQLRVRIVATGFCHTDEKVRHGARSVPTPVVLGHEGAGVVEAVGRDVTELQAGDHVLLSFAHCGDCANCQADHPAYCERMDQLNFGARGQALRDRDGKPVHSAFFGQSSFATHALVDQRHAIKVDPELPLELLAPLGCSIQTGAGAILNVLCPDEHSTLAVWGTGAVGLSAIAAATWTGTRTIVAIDVNPTRLALAAELGATHTIRPTPNQSALAALLELVPSGVSHAFDSTGSSAALRDAVTGLAPRGSAGFVGGGRAGDELSLEINPLLAGRSLQGIVQGDAVPRRFIPMLVERYRSGELPLERLVSNYPLEQINRAAADAQAGRCIKPVLTMTRR
jgi:aryl-alcohol dehydrogenase